MAIKPYRDWNKLYREGKAEGVKDIAQYIADNTNDPNCARNKLFVPGYLDAVEAFVKEKTPDLSEGLGEYKRKPVQGLYNFDHFQHPDGSFIQIRGGKQFKAVHQDREGNQRTFDNFDDLKKHLNEGEGLRRATALAKKSRGEKLTKQEEKDLNANTLAARMQKGTPKNKVKETVAVQGLAMLMESELEKAQVILAIQAIADKFQKMASDLAKAEADDIMPILDSMRLTFGPEVADNFNKITTAKIRETTQSVIGAKEAIISQLAKLEGSLNGAPVNDMAGDEGVDSEMPDDDMSMDMEPEDHDLGTGDEDMSDEVNHDESDDLDDILSTDDDGNAAGRARKESVQIYNARALREAANPDAIIFRAYRQIFRETREAVRAVKIVSESYDIDLADVIDVVQEAAKSKDDPCWKNYKMVGMKNKGGKEVPNCVPVKEAAAEKLTYKKMLGQHCVYCGDKMKRSFPSEADALDYIRKNQGKKTEVEEGKTWKDQKDRSNKSKDWSSHRKEKNKSRDPEREDMDEAATFGGPKKPPQPTFGKRKPDPLANVPLNYNDMKKKAGRTLDKEIHEEKKPDADGDGIPDWADKNPKKAGGKSDRVEEKFDMKPTPAAKKGMFDGKTKAELRKMETEVKAQMKSHEDKGEAVPKALRTKFSEITFALRAKNNWGKVDEARDEDFVDLRQQGEKKPGPKSFFRSETKTKDDAKVTRDNLMRGGQKAFYTIAGNGKYQVQTTDQKSKVDVARDNIKLSKTYPAKEQAIAHRNKLLAVGKKAYVEPTNGGFGVYVDYR